MIKGKKISDYMNLEPIRAIYDPAYRPKPMASIEEGKKIAAIYTLFYIRSGYKGEWNDGARYFYSELIRAHGLDNETRESLLELATPSPGRKRDVEMVMRMAQLKREGKTAKQIVEELELEGCRTSISAVESYFKNRRKGAKGQRTNYLL